jgi:tRNA G18 (ribose-2'-O)-methylase SpoU
MPQTVPLLHGQGFCTVALTPAEDAVPLNELRFAPSDRVALLLGAEGPGLDASTLEATQIRARIPMERGVDSLNVSTAAAIAFAVVRRGQLG